MARNPNKGICTSVGCNNDGRVVSCLGVFGGDVFSCPEHRKYYNIVNKLLFEAHFLSKKNKHYRKINERLGSCIKASDEVVGSINELFTHMAGEIDDYELYRDLYKGIMFSDGKKEDGK